jgi:hypothetical protein
VVEPDGLDRLDLEGDGTVRRVERQRDLAGRQGLEAAAQPLVGGLERGLRGLVRGEPAARPMLDGEERETRDQQQRGERQRDQRLDQREAGRARRQVVPGSIRRRPQ